MTRTESFRSHPSNTEGRAVDPVVITPERTRRPARNPLMGRLKALVKEIIFVTDMARVMLRRGHGTHRDTPKTRQLDNNYSPTSTMFRDSQYDPTRKEDTQ